MVLTVSLSFRNRRTINNNWRTSVLSLSRQARGRLGRPVSRIKSQISLRFADAVLGAIAIPAEQHCERLGCSCAACDVRTLDSHPLYRFDLARGDQREIHLHPRCHELWLEIRFGPRTEQDIDLG